MGEADLEVDGSFSIDCGRGQCHTAEDHGSQRRQGALGRSISNVEGI